MGSNASHEINLALRMAAGHERAAQAAEAAGAKQYEMKMKSAGASVYEAFVMAVRAVPEYQDRRIDDAAIRRLYLSTKPRPWWDVHLRSVKSSEGKLVDREWGKRLIQWHLDPDAAKARYAQGRLQQATAQRRLRAQRPARGMTSTPKPSAPTTAEMRAVHRASQETALAAHRLPTSEDKWEVDLGDLLGEVNRISAAVRRVKPEDREAVLDVLRTTAREVERYVS